MLNPKRIFVLTAFILLLAARLDAARPFPESVYDSLNSRSIFIFSDQLSAGTLAPCLDYDGDGQTGILDLVKLMLAVARN
jgi:hypothetical protein